MHLHHKQSTSYSHWGCSSSMQVAETVQGEGAEQVSRPHREVRKSQCEASGDPANFAFGMWSELTCRLSSKEVPGRWAHEGQISSGYTHDHYCSYDGKRSWDAGHWVILMMQVQLFALLEQECVKPASDLSVVLCTLSCVSSQSPRWSSLVLHHMYRMPHPVGRPWVRVWVGICPVAGKLSWEDWEEVQVQGP